MAKPIIVIAAVSARGFAQAAAASGIEVIALDAFADAETQAICAQTFKLKFNDNAVDETGFKHTFLNLNFAEIDGFCYGSLFDHCPDLLTWVAERVSLIGNAPEVLKCAKDFSFFALLDELNIAHPEVRLSPPEVLEDWLCKQFGGTGGTHIQPANQYKLGDYYQRKVAGTPISILFVADGKTARTIGFNQQFIAPTHEMPYRFAGAVSNIALQPNIHASFEHAAQQLTKVFNLRGINSLDAILENAGRDDKKLWILELNPRLSATFQLYENLFPLHIQGCSGDLADFQPQNKTSKAQLILYAGDEFEIPADFAWPSWSADIPALEVGESSVRIAQNAPICSVFAQAESAETAHTLVQKSADKLRKMLIK
jgi:uncharacterized protein